MSEKRIDSRVEPKGCLTKPGMDNHMDDHSGAYQGFIDGFRDLTKHD